MKKLAFLLIILISFCSNTFAQVPDTIWSKIFSISPNGDIDEGKCIIETNDGGYIVTGSCVPQDTVSHIDLLLLKVDTSGNIIWLKTYEKEFIEEGLSIQQTSDGGFIICGRALFITGPIPTAHHQSDLWIIKTDANGDTLWTKTYGGDNHDYCTTIKKTFDQGYILVGTTNSRNSYPPNCYLDCKDHYTSRAWLIKTDSFGDTLWTETFLEGSYGNYVQQTSDSGYIITGAIVDSTQMDLLLIKTNSSGDTLWTKIIGDSDSLDFGKCVIEVNDGYVITGHNGPTPPGSINASIIKTDLSGNILWQKNYGGVLSDLGNTIVKTSDDGFFITGIANAYWYFHSGDMWVFKTDAAGNLLWQRIYRLGNQNYAWCGTQTSDDNYLVTGMIGYSFGGDLWIAKLGKESSGINVNSSIINDYVLYQNYPNPFNPSTTIKFGLPKSSFVSLKIFDILGREVAVLLNKRLKADSYTSVWNAKNLSSGIYFYRLKTEEYIETRKMVLLK